MGIEPTYSAWKAEVLPLNYTRTWLFIGEEDIFLNNTFYLFNWWRGEDLNLRR